MSRLHIVREWSTGFRQLISGTRPFHLCPEAVEGTFSPGDRLEVRECERGSLTGTTALFDITYVCRGSDHHSAYEALVPPHVVVLGLAAVPRLGAVAVVRPHRTHAFAEPAAH